MIRIIAFTSFVVLLIPTLSQFGINLTPVNRCLGSCETCANDELSKCKSCIQGFSGPKCALDPSYIVKIYLFRKKIYFCMKQKDLDSLLTSGITNQCLNVLIQTVKEKLLIYKSLVYIPVFQRIR